MWESNINLGKMGDGLRGAENHDFKIWLGNELIRHIRLEDNFASDRVSRGLSYYSCTVNRNSQNV